MTTMPKTVEKRRFVLPSGVEPAPDILDDDMPEAMQQLDYIFDVVTQIKAFISDRPGAFTAGDGPVYYLDESGQQQYFKPDCMAVFDVDPQYIRARNGYFIEEVGKPPDFAMEIASVSTASRDTGFKRALYERLGIQEYFGFDPTGGDYYGVSLFGWRLRDGLYVPAETWTDADGATWAYSETLGLQFCAERESLRVRDPISGEFLRTLEESERERFDIERERDKLAAELAAKDALIQRLQRQFPDAEF